MYKCTWPVFFYYKKSVYFKANNDEWIRFSVTTQFVPHCRSSTVTAFFIVIDDPPDQVWLPQMVCFAASGPPAFFNPTWNKQY